MTRRRKIITIVAASIAGLILIVFVGAIAVMQTDWFANFVRQKIVAVTEESTGGKVELSRFDFNLWGLRASMDGFVLHGTEGPGQPPLFRAKRLDVALKLLSGLKQVVDLRSVVVDEPQANVIVYPDGRTNVPEPKIKKKSDKSGLETVVDLAIGHFELRNGMLLFADQKLPLNARGENLRAVLDYSRTGQSYEGTVNIAPLYVQYAKNDRANLTVAIPVKLERDRIGFDKARIATAESEVLVSGAVEHLVSPRISLTANSKVALAEVQRLAGLNLGKAAAGKVVTAAVTAKMGDNRIEITGLNAALGGSTIEASGLLKDPQGQGALDFKTRLALNELGAMFNVAAQPGGVATANGKVSLTADNNYRVTGNIQGRDLSFRQGSQRFSNINVQSAVNATPERIEMNGLRLDAFGGNFSGNAAVQNMARLELDGQLRNFDLETAARPFLKKPLGYSGVVSGPVQVRGDLKAPGATGFVANANLSVAPGRGRGVPVSGRINARYNGANEKVEIADSYLALPHSRLSLAGELDRQLNVQFRSTDLNDFLPAMQATSDQPVKEMPVSLQGGGVITFNGAITGKIASPKVTGELAASKFNVEGRTFDALQAQLSASQSGATLSNATLSRGNMTLAASANIELKNWKAEPAQRLKLDTTIRNGDVADLLALAGQPDVPITGTLNADVHLTGTVGSPAGTAQVTVTNGVAYEQPFQRAVAQIGFSNQRVTLSPADITMDAGRIQITGAFDHPADSWSTGTIQAQLNTNQIQLGQLRPVTKQMPGLSGALSTNARVTGTLGQQNKQTQFLLTSVNGDVNIRGLRAEGQNYGDLTATARTSGNNVDYRVESDFAGSNLRVNGNTSLQAGYPTTAKVNLQNLPIERLLVLAKKNDIPARGNLSGTAQFTGTMDNPNAQVDLSLAKTVIYDEPLDSAQLRASYTNTAVEIDRFEVNAAGGARIEGSASYKHAAGDLNNGQVVFRVASSDVQLAKLQSVQKYRSGLTGVLRLNAEGGANVRQQPKAAAQFLLTSLNATLGATGLTLNNQRLGDLKAAAQTTGGDRLAFTMSSNLAGAQIAARGQATLRGDYPLTADLTFANLTYSGLRPLLGDENVSTPLFDAFADGQATVAGPAMKAEAMTGKFTISRLEFLAKGATPAGSRPVGIRNEGPIVLAIDRSVVKVERARMTGPDTDINLVGSAALTGNQALDLTAKANTNLGILQQMSRSIYSSGAIVLDAAVRGTMSKPLVNGRLDMVNASFNYIDLPNGISNANGTVLFSGTNATIQRLTAETGGGKLTAGGFVSYGGPVIRYGLRARADSVRVRQPPGASIVASAQVNLTGTTVQSLLSGNVTLEKFGFSPQSDIGSLLARTSQPAEVPSAPSGPLAGMRLDVAIRTSPSASFETSLAQRLAVDADLRLRGTLASPGMTGRVNITEGEMVFFGTKYEVSQGGVNFYDPNHIRPVLNIDLQTTAKGVNVVLNVSGPFDNMKLTHRSDPPLQFSEIVALLATGKTPTSDPNLVANQPATPPQSLQQIGGSALLSQAIANPVSNRLERVFGVSKLKIDPTFTSGSELPQARLTLQQQISSNLTFTYITNLNKTNSQIIRVEWAFNPQWLAVASREEDGRFGVDFFYRRSFR